MADAVVLDNPIPKDLKKWWWLFVLLGVAWILVSLVLFRFNVSSVRAVGTIAGVVFLTWGVEELGMLAAPASVEGNGKRSPWRYLHGVLGAILVAAGIVALINPVNTFVAMAALVGYALLFVGIADVVTALANRDLELWWLRLVIGFLTLGLAVVVSGSFVDKAVFLVTFVAAGAIFRGVSYIAMGFTLRSVT